MWERGIWVVVYVLFATSNVVSMPDKLDEIMQVSAAKYLFYIILIFFICFSKLKPTLMW